MIVDVDVDVSVTVVISGFPPPVSAVPEVSTISVANSPVFVVCSPPSYEQVCSTGGRTAEVVAGSSMEHMQVISRVSGPSQDAS